MTTIIKKIRSNESGATAIEYGLIAALIAAVLIGGVTLLGGNINDTFNSIAGSVSGAAPDAGGGEKPEA